MRENSRAAFQPITANQIIECLIAESADRRGDGGANGVFGVREQFESVARAADEIEDGDGAVLAGRGEERAGKVRGENVAAVHVGEI